MIEETARHAGHLDIARELLDGTTAARWPLTALCDPIAITDGTTWYLKPKPQAINLGLRSLRVARGEDSNSQWGCDASSRGCRHIRL